ncbi:MAG: Tyrosyl-tRNA synthetase [Candidatus Magasanikbacteria bacterium GW2011_GWA2_46_17]|uniref:Tyrosine--tRNA ligase n=1 Tax=Candidatus Magasanikbacteria bacterium GW2011_GWA2_46_17 TaxID=1619042 RepID=A0A0G1P3H2_9BACT|nr:MAG: Tyrosyl-tRNA synthetase [Candidatus Magasanikbacteria bacterium GW2011_GWA2_46_17]
MKVNTNSKKIEELLTRGVENIYPTTEFFGKRLKSGEQLTMYTGYDPTAPTLHIGHGITLLKLRQFQELGHKVVMLIGDFTGMIGDPTDKTATRRKLTREQVLENCRYYQEQASSILDFVGDNPVEIRYNSQWLSRMAWEDVLELAAHVTVQRLLERDMFERRIKDAKPIYLHEFMYPLMQGYDSVAMDVDGEVGGNDQTFNMLMGRTMMKDLKNKEKLVLTMRLLADPSGQKMGKSEGNMVALSDSPEDMFGKVMSWIDNMIITGFELCTRVPMKEIKKMGQEMEKGINPRDYKLRLAYEVTNIFLGKDAADKAQERFIQTFSKREIPTEMPELRPSKYDIVTVLIEAKIVPSKSEARRVVQQGGVKVVDNKIDSIDAVVKPGDVVQKGSRWFVRVK